MPVAWDVHYDGEALWRVPLQRGWTNIPFPAKIEKWGDKVDFRIKVQDGTQTIAINGKEMYSESLPEHPDPWLAIQAHAGHYTGSVENLQITGSPKIPESVLITAAPDPAPWRSDYYGDTIDAADTRFGCAADTRSSAIFVPASPIASGKACCTTTGR